MCSHVNVGVLGVKKRGGVFEDIDKGEAWITYNPSPSVQTDNNTSGVSCPCQTVFVKHVRVTEQQ